MENTSIYSCHDNELSRNSVTPEYWNVNHIGTSVSAVISLLFFVIGVPSNLVIIVSILQQKLYQTPTYILLLNLAVSDFLICLLVMPPITVAGFAGGYIFGDSDYVRCQVCQMGLIWIALIMIAVYLLFFLSVDRFIFIKFALHHSRYVTMQRVIVVVISAWVLAISLALIPLSGFGEVKYSHPVSACTLTYVRRPENMYYAIILVGHLLLLILVMIVLNIWIACIASKEINIVYRVRMSVLKNQRTTSAQNESDTTSKAVQRGRKKKRDKQVTLMRVFGAILIANFVVWTPLLIITLLIGIMDESKIPNEFYIFNFFCLHLQALFHPLLEGCFVTEIKMTFKNILGVSDHGQKHMTRGGCERN